MTDLAKYYFAGNNSAREVYVSIENGRISIACPNSEDVLLNQNINSCKVSSALGSVPCEVNFPDGDLLILPADHPMVTILRGQLPKSNYILHLFEQSRVFWLIALLLVPVSFYLLVNYIIPSMAEAVAKQVPHSIKVDIDDEVLSIYDGVMFEVSDLELSQQEEIKTQWQHLLKDLRLDHGAYSLQFRKGESIGANAFALPGGTVVVTDELVLLFKDKPEAIAAILLHEIGHVELNHSMKILAESVGTTLLMTYFFGDLEGLVEIFSGTAVTLLQNTYSRDLESEADDFAVAKLSLIGQSPQAFADAMRGLTGKSEKQHALLKYFSSHPDIKQRINKAEKAAEGF
ncbi:M48 family metallopeptidase [Thalassotalea nanhaiensis]|uniref:M48 family metallopeptidase n=1 Tax=Thalassotalea nanhaiensis TaxID=3065648 RepID=A0ABY9TMD7_9GAMM|nr:M48 family metallopeptidase [Colwelliaceae bacterium SQ345]